jgi:glycerol uptake facilitator-like aquaporin
LHQRGGAQPSLQPAERGLGHGGAGGGGRGHLLAWSLGTTGYAINPARDLGPRLVHWLLPIPGKGGSNWSYALIPIAGPLLGGALAGFLVRYAHL